MSTKSKNSSGSQHNQRGVTQGVTLVDPRTGFPIATVVGEDGRLRLAVDANVTATMNGLEVKLRGTGPDADNVYLVDNATGNKFKVNADGSIDANVVVDGLTGTDSIMTVGSDDGLITGNKRITKIGAEGDTRVKDTEANTTLNSISNNTSSTATATNSLDTKIDTTLSTRASELTQLANNAELTQINLELDSQSTKLTSIDSSLNEIETDADAIRVATQATSTNIDTTLSSRATEATQVLNNTQLQNINTELETQTTILNSIDQSTNDIETATESINTKIDVTLSTRATEATQLLNNTQLQNINNELDTQTSILNNIDQSTNDIETRLETFDTNAGLSTINTLRTDSNQGLANTINNAWPTKLTDGITTASFTDGRLNTDVKISKNSGQIDTSGRIRATLPIELMSFYFANTIHPLKMNVGVIGTGSVALSLNKGSATMTNSLASGDKLNFATKQFVRYTPGQTHKCTVGGRIGLPTTNLERRWGMFTEFNGFFFKQTSAGLMVTVRDGGAGDPVVETSIPQSSWNIDKLDGTGKSGFNLNTDNQGIYTIEWDWHGSGVVKFGVVYKHETVYCHEFEYDFVQTDTSIRTPTLPVNIELKNVGALVSPAITMISAVSVYKDGESRIEPNYTFSASRGVSARTVTSGTETALVTIRPKSNFNGILARIDLVPNSIFISSASHPLYVKVVLNATLTGAAYNSVNVNSNAEFDISATTVVGGVTVFEGYVNADTSLLGGDVPGTSQGFFGQYQLGFNYDGSIPDTMTVVARSLGNNTATYASIKWLESQ